MPCAVESWAASLAQTWLENNWAGWQQTGKMVEKYSAQSSGIAGGGGEYAVQNGQSLPLKRRAEHHSACACRGSVVLCVPVGMVLTAASSARAEYFLQALAGRTVSC